MKTFIIALMLFFALASGISMMVLAFRSDFGELAADKARDRTNWGVPKGGTLPNGLLGVRLNVPRNGKGFCTRVHQVGVRRQKFFDHLGYQAQTPRRAL
jgi:hypothetical protein